MEGTQMAKSFMFILLSVAIAFIAGAYVDRTFLIKSTNTVTIDTVWRSIPPPPPIVRKGQTITVIDSSAVDSLSLLADSLRNDRERLLAMLPRAEWWYEDSVQRSRHRYDPPTRMYEDSVGYKPRKEMTIRKDSIIYREPTFWYDMQKRGEGAILGILIGLIIKK